MIAQLLLTLAAVVALGAVLGRLMRAVGQPAVVGEVLAGIVLGPSVLAAVTPDADPTGRVGVALYAVAQLGIVLYMFLVGVELNGTRLRAHAGPTAGTALGGVAVQLALAVPLAWFLYPRYAPAGVGFVPFAAFFGVALSTTGFTVLARFLADTGLGKTPLGELALGCAAVDDVAAWCLVAAASGLIHEQWADASAVLAGAVGFVAVVVFAVRPAVGWVSRRLDAAAELPAGALPLAFVGVLVAAFATERLGVHALFGAFLLGAVIPHDGRLAREVVARWKPGVTVLLLPAFFALTGLRTEIGLVVGWDDWATCGVILVVAVLGKVGGTYAAARLTGSDPRTAAALGVMMNTRGLMGLIVLTVGLNTGVISPALFAMMVLMALATTLATAPALARLLPSKATGDAVDTP